MTVSDIHVKGGELVRVLEDLEQSKLKMIILFVDGALKKAAGRLLLFDGVVDYQIFEERGDGCPKILGLSVAETLDRLSRIRLDTDRGYREIRCAAVRDCTHEAEA